MLCLRLVTDESTVINSKMEGGISESRLKGVGEPFKQFMQRWQLDFYADVRIVWLRRHRSSE